LTKSPETLAKLFGYRFDNPGFLKQALVHRSAGSRNNERLEFLGDAVLGAVIAHEVFARHPKAREGELSRMRSTLVRRGSLAELADELDIGTYLKLGPGERKSGGHQRKSILADAFEAVLGAIYLDGGFEPCRQAIVGLFAEKLDAITDLDQLKDHKTRLQEYLQSQSKPLPVYSVVEIAGESHAQSFRVRCTVSDTNIEPTVGQAKSRRRAEQDAAGKMLAQLGAG
jgi:ribonuclease-3